MKPTTMMGLARGVTLCSAIEPASPGVEPRPGIAIAGETFVPDAATAYVEFFLSHAFPVYLDVAEPGSEPYRTTIHPATVANSYRSLRGKVLNFAHIMRSYDPERNVRDRIFGTVMAVEFPAYADGVAPSGTGGAPVLPAGGWKVQGDPMMAPGIRAVAALHKNAEGVMNMIDTWQQGRTPFGGTEWTVSMENEATIADGGFLLRRTMDDDGGYYHPGNRLDEFAALGQTPDDFKALGWIYVPWAAAPEDLRNCLDAGGMIAVAKNFLQTPSTGSGAGGSPGVTTLFLNGGLNGTMFYYGVALTPLGKESRAQVLRMEASAAAKASNLDLAKADESAESNLDLAALAGAAGLRDALAELAGKVLVQ